MTVLEAVTETANSFYEQTGYRLMRITIPWRAWVSLENELGPRIRYVVDSNDAGAVKGMELHCGGAMLRVIPDEPKPAAATREATDALRNALRLMEEAQR